MELVDESDLRNGPDDGEERHHEEAAPARLEGEEARHLVRVRVSVRVSVRVRVRVRKLATAQASRGRSTLARCPATE